MASNHKYETRKCVDCGKELYVRYDSKTVRCKDCRSEKRRVDVGAYIQCENCGKTFLRKRKIRKFCSSKCRNDFLHKQNSSLLKCEICGKEFTRPNCHVSEHNFCSRECTGKWHSITSIGENHACWKGGKYETSGYLWLSIGGKRPIQEHRWVVEQALGRKLLPTEIVHHIDGNKKNNKIENLAVLTRAEHIEIHRKELQDGMKIKKEHRFDYLKKPVNMYSLNMEFLKRFESLTDAAKYMGKKSKYISLCAKQKKKSVYGYIWRFCDKS